MSKIKNLPTENMLALYFDGELSPEDAAQVEEFLREEAGEPLALQSSDQQTGDLLRSAYQGEVDQVDFSHFWEGVEAGLDRPSGVKGGVPDFQSTGLLARWVQVLGQGLASLRPSPLVFRSGLAMAGLAGLTLAVTSLMHQPDSGPVAAIESSPEAAVAIRSLEGSQATPGAPAVTSAAEINIEGIEINRLDGGSDSTVMVLHSPDQATIIWVQENEGSGGPSI